jgi:hypothetical protein
LDVTVVAYLHCILTSPLPYNPLRELILEHQNLLDLIQRVSIRLSLELETPPASI